MWEVGYGAEGILQKYARRRWSGHLSQIVSVNKLVLCEKRQLVRTDDHLGGGDTPPKRYIGPRSAEWASRHDQNEEIFGEVSSHTPLCQEYTENHGHERNGIFEARTIVNWLRMSMNKE